MNFVDGVMMNLENPDTFEIPSPAEKAAIREGDLIKAGFIGDEGTERMWIIVKAVDGPMIHGVLDNYPLVVSCRCGDSVSIHADNVLSIMGRPH